MENGIKFRTVPYYDFVSMEHMLNGVVTTTSSAGPNGGSSWYQNVTSSAIVHGDKKSPNPWTYSIRRRSLVDGSVDENAVWDNGNRWYRTHINGGFHLTDYPAPIPSKDPGYINLYNRALDNLNEKIRGGLDLSVDLAEAGKTAQMLNLVKRLQSTPIPRSWRTGLGLLSSAWLEWQYGWRPLIGSIYDCANESIRLVLNKTERFEAGATADLSDEVRGITINPSIPVLGKNWGLTVNTKLYGKRGVKIAVLMDTPQGFDLARFTSLNPASIAWELLPFSFVVDWVLDVGGYLRNLETACVYGSRFKGGHISHLYAVKYQHQGSTQWDFPSGSTRYSGQMTITTGNQVIDFQRSVLSSYPLPYLPRFDVQMGSSRLLSAAALLAQQIRR